VPRVVYEAWEPNGTHMQVIEAQEAEHRRILQLAADRWPDVAVLLQETA
jgi:hypothetical protein